MKKYLENLLGFVIALGFVLGLSLAVVAGDLTGIGSSGAAKSLILGSSTTCVTDSVDASANCALFPAGTGLGPWLVSTVIDGAGTLCFSLDTAVDLNDTDRTQIGNLAGDCLTFGAAGGVWDHKPTYGDLKNLGGTQDGMCSGKIASILPSLLLFPPCDTANGATDNTDCTALGLGGADDNCAAPSNTQVQLAGTFLVGESGGTPTATVRQEKASR